MGVCNSKGLDQKEKKKSVMVNTFENVVLSAPPNLMQKHSLPSNFNLILNNETLADKLCEIELNKNLGKGGKVDAALGEFITSNSLKFETLQITAPELFERIHSLAKRLKEFDKSKLVKKILDDFHKMVYNEFAEVIRESSRNQFFKDNNFCIRTICHLTELYQIILTFKVQKIEKKKGQMNFWWLPETTPPKDCEMNTFAYARKKFALINKEIGNQYKMFLGNQGESQPLMVVRGSQK